MNRDYALPISFALALHAALLFGFSKPPPRAPAPKVAVKDPPIWIVAKDEDPPIATDTDAARSDAKPALEAPIIRSPEPAAVVTTSTFEIKVPDLPAFEGRDATKIDIGSLTPGVVGGTGWGNVLSSALLDKTPRTRFQPAPIYPHEAKKDGIRGEVMVEFMVDEKGRVVDPRVVSSSHRMFEEPTLRAISRWVFEPGQRNGATVRFRMSVPIHFNLND